MAKDLMAMAKNIKYNKSRENPGAFFPPYLVFGMISGLEGREIDLDGYVEEENEDFEFSAYELESDSSSSSDDDECGARLTKKKCWTTMESGANVEQRLTRKKFIFYINLN